MKVPATRTCGVFHTITYISLTKKKPGGVVRDPSFSEISEWIGTASGRQALSLAVRTLIPRTRTKGILITKDPIRVWRHNGKKRLRVHPPLYGARRPPRDRRSVCSRRLGVCRNDNAVPAAHARARHVDDEGTYVRTQGRISYVCLTTRRNQISLRTQRKCRHIHSFIPLRSVEDARGTQHVSDDVLDDVRNDDATRGDGAGGVETTDGNNV